MWIVYILETKKGQLYTGVTNDLDRRIQAHRDGKGAKFTRNFGVKKICFQQKFSSKSEAFRRESYIKSLSRVKKLSLINQYRQYI